MAIIMASDIKTAITHFTRRCWWQATLALALNWGPIILMACVAERWPYLYPLAVLVISSRMLGLYELAHEALHYNLFQNRKWNDRLDRFYAIPFFYRVADERHDHLIGHHKMLDEEKAQPDYGYQYFYLNPQRIDNPAYMVWVLFGRPLLGFHVLTQIITMLKDIWAYRTDAAMWLFHGALALILTVCSAWNFYLWYWLVPYLTVYPVLWFWQDMLTHFKARDPSGSRDTRHWLCTLLLSPHHFATYHTLHHAWPTVPWFAMQEANKCLMDDNQTVCTHSIFEAFRQMIMPYPSPTSAGQVTLNTQPTACNSGQSLPSL